MNARDALVAKALSALSSHGEVVALVDLVTAVLDAVLPQVTTVAELEALPDGSLFLARGTAIRAMRQWEDEGGRRYYSSGRNEDGTPRAWAAETVLQYAQGALTVVWQPEVTS